MWKYYRKIKNKKESLAQSFSLLKISLLRKCQKIKRRELETARSSRWCEHALFKRGLFI